MRRKIFLRIVFLLNKYCTSIDKIANWCYNIVVQRIGVVRGKGGLHAPLVLRDFFLL